MRLTPTNDETATILKWAFIGFFAVIAVLVMISFAKATSDCQDQGGVYAKTPIGYKCLKEMDNG